VSADRLAMSVTHADGTVTRWGPDEPKPTEIPGDLTFGSQMPGGFKDLSCSLLRRIDLEYPDLSLFDTVRVYAPGNRTVWEGRMAQFPRSHGDGFSITPGAVGWSAHLTDDPTFTEVYVDRDPGAWGDTPLDRRIQDSAGISTGDFSWAQVAGGLSVSLPNQALGAFTSGEAWALGPAGRKIAKIMYRGATTGLPAGWLIGIIGQDTLGLAGDQYNLTFDDTLRTQVLTTAARQHVGLFMYSNGTAATPAAGALVRATKIARYGNHGLTTRANGTEPDGVYASDVIANIVSRAAPLLTVASGAIQATTFVIPHLVFAEPTTAESAIQLVNAYHGYDWGVYDNKQFFYRASDPALLTWQARLSTGARLDLEGDTAEQVFNGVYVTYQDPNGQKKTVGPTGASADDTSASLLDASTTNPATAHGITRRWGMLEISQTTTLAGATQLGAIWLTEHAAPQRRGTLTLTGTVTHPTEGEVPVSRVRAGDYVSIADHPADVPRRIIEARYTHGSRQTILNLDNTPFMLDAIMQRLGVGLVGVL
jgi:hypothetical protein